MKTLHYSIIGILAFVVIMILIIEFPLYRGPNPMMIGSKLYQAGTNENNLTNSETLSPHGLPITTNFELFFNGSGSSEKPIQFDVIQGQNVTLVVNVTSSHPENVNTTLYTLPHIGFTSTNGLDLKFSSTHIVTPSIVLLHILVGKDATPNTYRTSIFSTTEDGLGNMSLGTYIGITVKPQNRTMEKLQNTSIYDTEVTPMSTNVTNTGFSINYAIVGGQLENATANIQEQSLDLSLKTTENGTLTVILPRGLIDPKIHGQDNQFIIVENGREVKYKQIVNTITDRMLIIPFQYGVTKMEIIAPEPIR